MYLTTISGLATGYLFLAWRAARCRSRSTLFAYRTIAWYSLKDSASTSRGFIRHAQQKAARSSSRRLSEGLAGRS